MEREQIIKEIAENLLCGDSIKAKNIILEEYPHCPPKQKSIRTYTDKQKLEQFVRDGFIDRYSGKKLLNPGILKVITHYFPEEFPYQPHWKMDECHLAYWELTPTLDHIVPIAGGGKDEQDNWATTSMINNSIKNNFTLEQLRWELYPAGNFEEWDGLTGFFITLVESDQNLLEDKYIQKWYNLSKKIRTRKVK